VNRITRSSWLAFSVGAALLLGACSSSSGSDSSDTTAAPTTTAASGSDSATVKFDKTIQTELKTVGCYSGEIDGAFGPETDAAIIAFQTAEGLTVDGELGPDTDSALDSAAGAGTVVCDGSTTTTTTAGSTTTTAAGGGTAPCTATAVTAGLSSGESLTTYICSEGWAAGAWTNGDVDGSFIFESVDGAWATPGQDPCGSASAGVPAEILSEGCTS
jgi:hypothetical protein